MALMRSPLRWVRKYFHRAPKIAEASRRCQRYTYLVCSVAPAYACARNKAVLTISRARTNNPTEVTLGWTPTDLSTLATTVPEPAAASASDEVMPLAANSGA